VFEKYLVENNRPCLTDVSEQKWGSKNTDLIAGDWLIEILKLMRRIYGKIIVLI